MNSSAKEAIKIYHTLNLDELKADEQYCYKEYHCRFDPSHIRSGQRLVVIDLWTFYEPESKENIYSNDISYCMLTSGSPRISEIKTWARILPNVKWWIIECEFYPEVDVVASLTASNTEGFVIVRHIRSDKDDLQPVLPPTGWTLTVGPVTSPYDLVKCGLRGIARHILFIYNRN